MQTAVDRLGDIKKQVLEGLEEFSHFKELQKTGALLEGAT